MTTFCLYTTERCADCDRPTHHRQPVRRYEDTLCAGCLTHAGNARDMGRIMAGDDGERDTVALPRVQD